MRKHAALASLVTPDVRGRWGTVCVHGTRETWPSQRVARIARLSPQDWCDQCAAAHIGQHEDGRRAA
jgi:hypothetical protein